MKTITVIDLLMVVAVLSAGNFAYQAFFEFPSNWLVAAERSWFQAWAAFIAWWIWK